MKSAESRRSVYFEPQSILRQIYHFFHHQKESLLEILVSSTEIIEGFRERRMKDLQHRSQLAVNVNSM